MNSELLYEPAEYDSQKSTKVEILDEFNLVATDRCISCYNKE